MLFDAEKFAAGLHDYLGKAFAPIVGRLLALEAREPLKGDPGKDADPEHVRGLVLEAVAALPKPQDGKSVTLDDLLPVLKSMQAEWALDFERRAQVLFQKAVEAMPKAKDGEHGKDGIGWDSMRVEHDGRRKFGLIFTKGEEDHAFEFVIPCVIDAGFYKDGMLCQKGDGVTFGGSYWIAQQDTDTKPEIGNPAWRLGVKKGRDSR